MKSYDNFAHTFSESRKNLRWPELDAIIEDIDKNNFSRILDIWCGNGRFLEFYYQKNGRFPDYIGVDSSWEMITEAQKIYPNANFLVAEMQNIFQKNLKKTFDAIVFLASFHHLSELSDREQTLKNMHSLLNPGGKIYLTNWNLLEQNHYQKSQIAPQEFMIKIGKFHRYYYGFFPEELKNLCEKNGFFVETNKVFPGGRNIFTILSSRSL